MVNHMIRLKGLKFGSSQSGPQERTLRESATGPAAASRAKGSGLSFLSEDMNNVILDACGAGDAEGDASGDPPAARAPASRPRVPEVLTLAIAVPPGGFKGPRVTVSTQYGKFTVATPAGAMPGTTVHVSVRTVDQAS